MHLRPFRNITACLVVLPSVVLLVVACAVLVRGVTWRQNIRAAVIDTILAANQAGNTREMTVNGFDCLKGFTPDQIQSINYSNPYSIIVNTKSMIFYVFEFRSSESSRSYTFDHVEKRRWTSGKNGGPYEMADERSVSFE
jgi:hypothetical protein